MYHQVQGKDNQSGQWDVVADENGDECYTKDVAEKLESKTKERYPLTETRIVSGDSLDWI